MDFCKARCSLNSKLSCIGMEIQFEKHYNGTLFILIIHLFNCPFYVLTFNVRCHSLTHAIHSMHGVPSSSSSFLFNESVFCILQFVIFWQIILLLFLIVENCAHPNRFHLKKNAKSIMHICMYASHLFYAVNRNIKQQFIWLKFTAKKFSHIKKIKCLCLRLSLFCALNVRIKHVEWGIERKMLLYDLSVLSHEMNFAVLLVLLLRV